MEQGPPGLWTSFLRKTLAVACWHLAGFTHEQVSQVSGREGGPCPALASCGLGPKQTSEGAVEVETASPGPSGSLILAFTAQPRLLFTATQVYFFIFETVVGI